MLYDLTVRQINKAKTGEKLADLKKQGKCILFSWRI